MKTEFLSKNITPITSTNYQTIIANSMSKNTRIAYQKGWQRFQLYCDANNVTSLPATVETVINFITLIGSQPVGHNAKMLSLATVMINVSAINKIHKLANYTSPTQSPQVELLLSGLKRMRDSNVRRVMALQVHHIKQMLQSCENNLTGIRNAAIIALGFSAALRRSEITQLKLNDIKFVSDKDKRQGIKIFIRKSKTDQEGKGQTIAVPYGKNLKVIELLENWIKISGIKYGFLFTTVSKAKAKLNPLHDSDIARIVKLYAKKIGLDSSKVAGHSLRSGFVTSAIINRARLDKIMEVTRHKNPSVLLGYIRDSNAFNDHAGDSFL